MATIYVVEDDQNIREIESFSNSILTGSPLLAPGSDGINGVNAGAKANRKVRVNGQIMIIKNGQKSTVSGVTLK